MRRMRPAAPVAGVAARWTRRGSPVAADSREDRKSTRLNSSHVATSYAVFCLKKKSSPELSFATFLLTVSLLTPIFFFNDPATTEIYTLSLHDALPIFAADSR